MSLSAFRRPSTGGRGPSLLAGSSTRFRPAAAWSCPPPAAAAPVGRAASPRSRRPAGAVGWWMVSTACRSGSTSRRTAHRAPGPGAGELAALIGPPWSGAGPNPQLTGRWATPLRRWRASSSCKACSRPGRGNEPVASTPTGRDGRAAVPADYIGEGCGPRSPTPPRRSSSTTVSAPTFAVAAWAFAARRGGAIRGRLRRARPVAALVTAQAGWDRHPVYAARSGWGSRISGRRAGAFGGGADDVGACRTAPPKRRARWRVRRRPAKRGPLAKERFVSFSRVAPLLLSPSS